ncbi:unnamed protein product, partial [Allacma fusca]
GFNQTSMDFYTTFSIMQFFPTLGGPFFHFELKKEFKTQDLQNLESLMRNKVEEGLKQKLSDDFGDILTHKREFIQTTIIIEIRDFFWKTARNVCRKETH